MVHSLEEGEQHDPCPASSAPPASSRSSSWARGWARATPPTTTKTTTTPSPRSPCADAHIRRAEPKGALVVFEPVPTMTAAGLQKIIDCHLACNDAFAHNVPWMLYCPLVPRDVTAKVTQTSQGLAVTIETPDPDAAREVQYRVTELIKTR